MYGGYKIHVIIVFFTFRYYFIIQCNYAFNDLCLAASRKTDNQSVFLSLSLCSPIPMTLTLENRFPILQTPTWCAPFAKANSSNGSSMCHASPLLLSQILLSKCFYFCKGGGGGVGASIVNIWFISPNLLSWVANPNMTLTIDGNNSSDKK